MGALNLAMAGQYLLDQGRAGTRQTDDQYGRGITDAMAGSFFEELLAEHLDQIVGSHLGLYRVVFFRLASCLVAQFKILEGLTIVLYMLVAQPQGVVKLYSGQVPQFRVL